MEALGWALQQQLGKPGTVVLLNGQLGAGKSTIARGFVRAFCKDPLLDVPSPTFLLCLSYRDDMAHASKEAGEAAPAAPAPGEGAAADGQAATCSGSDAAPAAQASTSAAQQQHSDAPSASTSGAAPPMAVHHMDPYRLGQKCDKMAGLIDFGSAFEHDVCLIEWPSHMPQEVMKLARRGVSVEISGMGTQASGRLVTITPLQQPEAAAASSSAAATTAGADAADADVAQGVLDVLRRWREQHPSSLPPTEVQWRSGQQQGGAGGSGRGPLANEHAMAALQGDPAQWLVLGIESSCDDTAAAVVRGDGTVLGHMVASQTGLHEQYGGVKPDVACQAHAAAITGTVEACLAQAGVAPEQLTAVAVTAGPGLALCLQVGVSHALKLAARHSLPLVPVHHMEAHALMTRMPIVNDQPMQFPSLLLLVSGGHNMLVLCEGVGRHRILGTTLDDSVGECFDKIARLVGITAVPGGPHLERLAGSATGSSGKIQLTMPLTMGAHKDTCNFSFSGLKTQVSTLILQKKKELGLMDAHTAATPAATAGAPADGSGAAAAQAAAAGALDEGTVAARAAAEAEFQRAAADIAAAFQVTAVKFLQQRTRRALQWLQDDAAQLGGGFVKSVVVAGGVAANQAVRQGLGQVAAEFGLPLVCPPVKYCTDNGLMVAWTGVERLRLNLYHAPPRSEQEAERNTQVIPRWPIGPVDPRSISHNSKAFFKAFKMLPK